MRFFTRVKSETIKKDAPSRSAAAIHTALRFAFSPEIGRQVRPIQESTQIFVQLIAAIFVAMKMFPANHPALTQQDGAKLSLPLLIATSWRDLKFTKQNTPQILTFFLLCSGLAFAAIALTTLAISILGIAFAGRAHAEGYFTSPAGDDIAQSWLDFFRDGSMSGGFFAFAEPLTMASGLQGAMISALGFYSDAILVVAAVILFYHLVAMTAETAHEGVVMGKKANQIWAPIRLVVAIGLLVPIGGGLNSGQYIVYKVAGWGSGLASNLWEIFLGGFANGVGVAGIPQFAPEVVYNTLLSESCKDNRVAEDKTLCDRDPKACVRPGEDSSTSGGADTKRGNSGERKPVGDLHENACGHHSVNTSSTNPNVANASACYDQLQQAAKQRAQELNKQVRGEEADGENHKDTRKNPGVTQQLMSDWLSCITGGLQIPNLLGVFAMSSTWGWLSAGGLVSAISQAEADATDLGALIPDVAPPLSDPDEGPATQKAHKETNRVAKILQQMSDSNSGGGSYGSDKCAAQRGQLIQQAYALQNKGPAHGHFLDRIFEVIDWLAQWNCVWTSQPPAFGMGQFSLGIMFIGANPLAEMARLGHACIDTAYQAFDIMVNLGAKGKGLAEKKGDASASGGEFAGMLNVPTEGAQGALAATTGILAMVTNIFFVAGIVLAYYVPLIPLFSFMFSALSWVMAVLEAIIAIPLFAVAHLSVQGDGLPGQHAKAGYYFILQIALKPALMVFGMAVALLTFYAAISYLNLFYPMAISTAGGVASAHLFLSRLLYNGMYVVAVYMCANACFKAIHIIPEHAMKWMGQQGFHFAHMGEPSQILGPVQSTANQVISGTTGSVDKGGWGAATMMQGGGPGRAIANTANEQHAALPSQK